MDHVIQTLLEPMADGSRNIADVAIEMPETVAEALRQIFQFEVMGLHEFEGTAIYNAIRRFYRLVTEGKICQISYYPPEDSAKTVHVLCPMDLNHAVDAVDFVRDQLSDSPQKKCLQHIRFKEAVMGTEHGDEILPKTVGWFDLGEQRFFFIDIRALTLFKALFGLTDIPTLDQDLNFSVQIGETFSHAAWRLQKLSDALQQPFRVEFNSGQVIDVLPSPAF